MECVFLKCKHLFERSTNAAKSDYVKEKQKEKQKILDKELEDKYNELSSLKSEYCYKMAKYTSDNIDKALESLDYISDSD